MKTLVYLVYFASACALAFAQQNKNANASAPPITPAEVTASSAADPWLGSWVLNVAKTRINPGPAPKGETRTYTSTASGERATYDETQADGKRVYSTSTYRFDGQDAKVVGDPDSHTHAIKRTSPRSIASVIKKDGKVVRTATREVSADGKILTVEFKGTNAKGQPIIEEKWVFDRRDEPWLGTWELNAVKSRIAPSAKPKFDFRTFTPTAGGEHAVYVTIESDGKPTRSECNIVYNGTDQPVVAGEPGETLAFTRASARALAFTNKQNGKVVSTGTRTVSADGKVLTVTVKHVERGEEVWVLERRAADMAQTNLAAAIKAAVATHWHAINGGITATVDRQHTADISVFLADVEPRMLMNSPAWLAMLPRWQGAKANWTLRDVEVQPLGAAAAAASFYMDGSVRWADGRVDSRPRRVTEIWVNENGTWKEAHHHDSVFTANPKPAAQ
ncbi:MAG: DUF4440 domain-containing protein [Opitutaceae bacterium]|nr:DUF4440 domain-containing protein [Opitutaceae bacterium]